MTGIILAIVLGAAFGFTLDRIGATNPGYIIRMLNLSNLHLAKTIMAGIGVASVLMFAGLLLGLVDSGHLSVKSTFVGVFVGGVLLGIGFAIAGYCPGTGLTAAATGRIDGVVFSIGGLLGAGAYMGSHAWVASTGLLEEIAGGKTTLGPIAETGYPALFEALPGEWLGLALGAVFVIVAWLLPGRIGSKDTKDKKLIPAE